MALQGEAKRKAYGQHFLIDTQVIDAIVRTTLTQLDSTGARNLLEIGPGGGALTTPLLQQLAGRQPRVHYTVSEMDRKLANEWTTQLPVLEGDFLDHASEKWLPEDGSKIVVVSNLPYSSGTAITVRLAEFTDRVPAMVLMFQAEVARRLRAEPSTKAWGSLSLWIQNRWDVSFVCAAPPRAFKPAPKVDSEVVLLRPRGTPRIALTQDHPELWQKLLTAAFQHRRKMLRGVFAPETPERKALDRASLDGTKRAEALSWDEWNRWFSERVALGG